MKVADYIINHLADCRVREVFVVYGAANGDLIDAFTRVDPERIRYVAVMHEQAGGFAAEGYAKISRNIGVAIATSGPGGMNFITPMGNCYFDSVPCLFITGQVNSKFLRTDTSLRQVGFQECDIVGMAKPVTKYAVMVTKPENIRYELEKALFLAKEGRPGPVLLDIPLDVQAAEIDSSKLHGFNTIPMTDGYSRLASFQIEKYLDDLEAAKRPVMLIGGGVRISGATELFREVAKRLKIPCFPTWNALDVVTSDLECYGGRIGTYGGAGRNFGLQNADLVLAVGCRVSGRITGSQTSSFLRGAKKYLVDVDEALLQKHLQQVPFDVNIASDAFAFFGELFRRFSGRQVKGHNLPDFSKWMAQCADWRDTYDPVLPEYYEQKEYANPYVFFRMLSEEMGAQDILVGDCGGNIVISNHAFKTKFGQRNITNNGNSPMGFSFAGAIGAWFANQGAGQVVCTIGDGGFNMNIQELQTLLNYGVNVKTFIVNNHVYGITKFFQERKFGGRAEACGPKGYNPPDFVKIVNAYGIKTFTIGHNSEIRDVVREVLAYDGPVVCDVNCHEWHIYAPSVSGGRPIEDMLPLLPRDEFRRNMIIEPVPGWDKSKTEEK